MRALVTGGGGFLGSRIVELLRERGDDVVFLARRRYPEVEATGAKGLQLDLRDKRALASAVECCDVVFHVAAKAGFWGSRTDYYRTNVDGTRHLLDAMRQAGCGKLVYTSTPSVLGYDHDVEKGGFDLPHATRHESYYPETKSIAERIVTAANGEQIATVALRPHLIFGPKDQLFLPRVISRARQGALPRIGDGTNRVDLTYIDNAAHAHLDACAALTGPAAPCAGKAYFVSNDEPVLLWDWFGQLFDALDVPRPRRTVSRRAARLIGGAMEAAHTLLPLRGEPRLTRFLVNGLARSHWYDMGPASRDLGYSVRVPMDAGLALTIEGLKGRV